MSNKVTVGFSRGEAFLTVEAEIEASRFEGDASIGDVTITGVEDGPEYTVGEFITLTREEEGKVWDQVNDECEADEPDDDGSDDFFEEAYYSSDPYGRTRQYPQ